MIGGKPICSLTRKPAARFETRRIASELSANVTKSLPAFLRARQPVINFSRPRLFGGSSSVTLKVCARARSVSVGAVLTVIFGVGSSAMVIDDLFEPIGRSPGKTLAIAEIVSGVVPQQPPTKRAPWAT